jgi:hypothetical protein
MATLKDLQYSQQGEVEKRISGMKDVSGLVKYDPKVKTEEKEWYIFKLVESNRKGGCYIPNVDDVYNPTTNKIERVRLLSGVDSIWQKDQKDLTPEYIRKNMRNIEFPRGHKMRRVSGKDSTMLEYMRICNFNVGNVNRIAGNGRFEFFEYDSAAAETEAFEKENFELEVAILAKQEKPEVMRKHAAFLGIRLINDIGERKTDDGIRREYVMYAKRNPHYFKQTMNSKQIEVSWLVKKGIADSLIEIGREPGKIFWAKGGGQICVIPQNQNPQDYLTELAMTNSEDGKLFIEQLKQVVT